jgi:hypothetical protein
VTTEPNVERPDRTRLEGLGGLLVMAGGLAAVPLWLVFTSVHGPTSFNENNITLGRDMHSWGSLLGVIPNALVAAGLWLGRPMLVRGGGRAMRMGFGLVLLALLASAALDLAAGSLGPPIFLPLLAAGLIVLALSPRDASGAGRPIRRTLLILGVLLAVAFAWALLPLDVSDRVGGYRLFGVMAHLLGGIGWAILGFLIARRATTETAS